MPSKFPKSTGRSFTKNLVKNYRLVPHLEQYLGKEVTNFQFAYEPKKKDDGWHPSGHCVPAPRELYYYAQVGHETPHDWGATMLKTFLIGHFWHQLLQKAVVDLELAGPEAIERRGMRLWGESTYDEPQPWHWATGAGDVAPLEISGWSGVVDFKTMNSHQFKSQLLPVNVAWKYEAQINIYMDFFDLDHGLIVPIQKDTPHEMKEFEFVRNQPLIDAIYDKWMFVSECLTAKEYPSALDDDTFKLNHLFTGPVIQ